MPGQSYVVFLVLLALALVAGLVYFRVSKGRRVRRMLLSLWGFRSERKVTADELLAVRGQAAFLCGDEGFAVDDITWNDLDMDRLYAAVNSTLTDAGDISLYRMLRQPLCSAEAIRRRGETMAWAAQDETGRESVKRALYGLGRTRGIDLPAMLGQDWSNDNKRLLCAILSLLLVGLIVLCAFGVWVALLPAMILAIVNIVISLRSRAEVGKYFGLFQYVPAVLHAAKRVAEADIPALGGETGRIRDNLGKIKGILGNNLLNYYYSFNNQSASNPIDVLLATFNYFFLIDIISMYNLSRHIFRYRQEIAEVFALLGEIDALIAAASFRETMPSWCEPEFIVGELRIRFEDAAHPLLEDPVTNSCGVERNMLLTGSNATGKSTFLKTVAMNAILAQSLDTCAAVSWQSGFFRVYTSMALRDDMFSNESYFVTEIKSLKRMLLSVGEDVPSLCIVDEVLRGTNTGERIAAASEALMRFAGGRCLCLAATHDIELTYILESLFENMHFSETITPEGIAFDYKLKPGRSKSRNAIKLLELLGYGKELVQAASARLEEFEKTGRWRRAEAEE